MLKIILPIAVFLGLAALWRWTPLGEWLDIDAAIAAIAWLKQQPYTPLLVPLFYILGGLVSFPVILMIIATMVIFGPWQGFFYSLMGAELSALTLFFAGHWLGRDTVSRFAGTLLDRLDRKLSDSGIWAVITFRLFPVAPFSVINIIAGVSGIRLQNFVLGTIIGLLPSLVVMAVAVNWIADSMEDSEPGDFAIALAAVIIAKISFFSFLMWLRGRYSKKKKTGSG